MVPTKFKKNKQLLANDGMYGKSVRIVHGPMIEYFGQKSFAVWSEVWEEVGLEQDIQLPITRFYCFKLLQQSSDGAIGCQMQDRQ